MKTSSNGYSSEYSESTFWEKMRRYARPAGLRVVEQALQLFYAARHPDTPAWARAVIYGALGYFILPTDAVPDLIPGVGFTDDFGVLVMALTTIATRITPEIRELARRRTQEWFG